MSYKPTTSQIADLLGFEPRTPWLTAKCSTFELQVQAELKQRKMVSMDGRTRTCDLCIPNAVRYQLRHIHIRSYQMCWLHPPITWVGIGISPTPFSGFSLLYHQECQRARWVCHLPHHKGRKSFSIHQILMKISFQRFSASVELLTMSKNSVSRVVRSHCKCRNDFLIHQIFWRIFSCWL